MANDKTTLTDGDNVTSGHATEPEDTPNNTTSLLDMELPPVSDIDESYEQGEPEEVPETAENTANERVIQEEDTNAGADKIRGVLDDKGGAYDPAVHTFPAEKTPSGKWKKIPKSKLDKTPPEDVAENSNNSIRLEAQKAATIYATLHVGIFGADGRPTDKAYFLMLVDSFENYMIENGVVKMPAGIDTLFSMGIFSLDVVSKETNKAKLAKWGKKSFSFFKGIFSKNKKVEEIAPKIEEVIPSA